MMYVDYSYEPNEIELCNPEYDVGELPSRFLAFVKGHATAKTPRNSPQIRYETQFASSEHINERVIHQSEQLIFSGALDDILFDHSREPAERLWEIFKNSVIGNPDNRRFEMPSWLRQRIAERREQALPLNFVLLAFPFKDQNPFRTVLEPWEIDLGEIVFLGRLAALAMAAWRIHPFGANWIILSDAVLYAKVFEIPTRDAERYVAAVRSAIQRYNLHNMIQIVDLRNEAERHFARASIDFDGLVTKIGHDLAALVEAQSHTEVSAAFSSLVRGQVQGLNLRSFLGLHDPMDIWHAVYRRGPWWENPDAAPRNSSLEIQIHELARTTAIRYAATNIALALTGVTDHLVPGALRSTVHAKPEQIAVPRLGRSYPWCGTAVLHADTGSTEAFAVEVKDVSDLLIDQHHHGVILPGHDRPWYFTDGKII
jgi:hypothetical protein